MIHYHGTPITPRPRLLELAGRSFCVSFAEPRDVEPCHEIGQSVMLDNGAFTYWRSGRGQVDTGAFAAWAAPWLEHQTTWAVIPDVIEGSEDENDQLLVEWLQTCLPRGAPVWHMHESLERLHRLCISYPRVCIGSSGAYATVGDDRWHHRMREAMDSLCGDGPAPCWLHMLRAMRQAAGGPYPFASTDSTNLARNHAGSHRQRRRSLPALADEVDARQTPAIWRRSPTQLHLHSDVVVAPLSGTQHHLLDSDLGGRVSA